METKCGERTTQSSIFPLFLYQSKSNQINIQNETERMPNLKTSIVNQFATSLKIPFSVEMDEKTSRFSPYDVFDYIYGVFHSPRYRKEYKEFIKLDFPKIPYPKDPKSFWNLVKLGNELRHLHLLESSKLDSSNSIFPIKGDNKIEKIKYDECKVFINQEQFFEEVSEVAWNFFIGGYQPAQKWLKDRKGRILTDEDIIHYQKIIVALTETDRLMKEIDKIDFMEDDSTVQYHQNEDDFQIAADSGNE
jgi:predicted helicase